MRQLYFYILVFLYSFTLSCKTEFNDVEPQLEVIVLDVDGNVVEGANVLLFESELEWINKTNNIQNIITNELGVATFIDLKEIVYFFSVSKGDLSNKESSVLIKNKLKINTKAQVITIIKL